MKMNGRKKHAARSHFEPQVDPYEISWFVPFGQSTPRLRALRMTIQAHSNSFPNIRSLRAVKSHGGEDLRPLSLLSLALPSKNN